VPPPRKRYLVNSKVRPSKIIDFDYEELDNMVSVLSTNINL
jgi:hypothetical protein